MAMRGYFIDPEGKCFREFDERLAELEKSKKNADDDKKWRRQSGDGRNWMISIGKKQIRWVM